MTEVALDVMLIEPGLNERVLLRSLISRHESFGRCMVASTLLEASEKVRAGYPIDAFFISSKLDAPVIGSFVEMSRSSRYIGAANLLVISPQTKIISREMRETKVDGILLRPHCIEDLNPAVDFVTEHRKRRKSSNISKVQQNLKEHLGVICAQASFALDTGSLPRLQGLRQSIEALDDESRLCFADTLCEYFCQFAEEQDSKITSPEGDD